MRILRGLVDFAGIMSAGLLPFAAFEASSAEGVAVVGLLLLIVVAWVRAQNAGLCGGVRR